MIFQRVSVIKCRVCSIESTLVVKHRKQHPCLSCVCEAFTCTLAVFRLMRQCIQCQASFNISENVIAHSAHGILGILLFEVNGIYIGNSTVCSCGGGIVRLCINIH